MSNPPPCVTGVFDAIDPAQPVSVRAAGVERALADDPRAALELLAGLVAQAYGVEGIRQLRTNAGVLPSRGA